MPSGMDAIVAPGLLSAADLLIELWPNPNSRPSLRWLREQKTARRMLPYIKMGHKVFFNPIKVRQALEKTSASTATEVPTLIYRCNANWNKPGILLHFDTL